MDNHQEEIKLIIERLVKIGKKALDEVLEFTEGADIRQVNELLIEVLYNPVKEYEFNLKRSIARNKTSYLPILLPSSNPLISQWWFTLDSIERLSEKVYIINGDAPIAFLGAPTIGYYYINCFEKRDDIILDIDNNVIDILKQEGIASAIAYNCYDDLPSDLSGKFSSVIIDPPWYDEKIRYFIFRAFELLKESGYIFCMLPPRLTRPLLIEERNQLINDLINSGFKIISIESNFVKYLMPPFEQYAFRDIDAIKTNPWRNGDVLIIQKQSSAIFKCPIANSIDKYTAYSRNDTKLRVFQKDNISFIDQKEEYIGIKEFESNVSTRKFDANEICVWTTSKKAIKIKNYEITKFILEKWSEGLNKDDTILALEKKYKKLKKNHDIVSSIDELLEIWKNQSLTSKRKTPEEIDKLHKSISSSFSTSPTLRNIKGNFKPDGFRLEFQRDRDRILWSTYLKKLANKCQVFPANGDDSLRRRLSHSNEVMQLATTISTSFGLDRDLTEAGAFVHDIGHTPFGHAGEFALDKLLDEIDTRIGGFNHYEHGVDVVCWLEDAYRAPSAGGIPGLNLTYETIECIIKHTFHRNNHRLGQTELIKRSKHSFLRDDSCHLEGQSIRIADKISYLISDIEDGIKMGAIELKDIMSCSFFLRPPIDIVPSVYETLYERFISQRRSILKVIMEDVLYASDNRLSSIDNLSDVRKSKSYIIDHSYEIKIELSEIWTKLQDGILHKHPKVIESNLRAARILSELFFLYTFTPELINRQFLRNHELLKPTSYLDFYYKILGPQIGVPKRILAPFSMDRIIGNKLHSQGDNWQVDTYNIILAKDYIASLTDNKALNEYRKHIGMSMD